MSSEPMDRDQQLALVDVQHAAQHLETAKAARDQALSAATTAGLSIRAVAAAAGISHTRVGQIVRAPHDDTTPRKETP